MGQVLPAISGIIGTAEGLGGTASALLQKLGVGAKTAGTIGSGINLANELMATARSLSSRDPSEQGAGLLTALNMLSPLYSRPRGASGLSDAQYDVPARELITGNYMPPVWLRDLNKFYTDLYGSPLRYFIR